MLFLQRFVKDTQGAVAVIVGAGIIMLVGAVGVAVDVGRGQMAQTKLQNALDAAGLAAGASVSTENIEAEVMKYMRVNFSQGTLGATITTVTPVLSQDKKLLTVQARASMPTTFMKIFGRQTMQLAAETEVTRTSKGMELAMVLDITGSMNDDGKLAALKTASNDLLDILFGAGNSTADNLWVGIVPFSMAVNVGPSRTAWLQPGSLAAQNWATTSWRGCMEARWTTGNDLNDATPATERFLPYYAPDASYNDWANTTTNTNTDTNTLCGPNSTANNCRCTPATGGPSGGGGTRVCGTTNPSANVSRRIYCNNQTSSNRRACYQEDTTTTTSTTYTINSTRGPNTNCPTSQLTMLTNQRSTLNTAITALTAVGGTHIPTGAAWGWRLLSPSWRGLWGGSMNTNNLPLDYNSDLMIKAMILMTDGQNTMYTNAQGADGAYGITPWNHTGMTSTPYTDAKAGQRLDVKTKAICDGMKQRGIVIYVVVLGVDDADVVSQVRGCASQTDYYFNAPDAASLRQSFSIIGDSLSKLRISR